MTNDVRMTVFYTDDDAEDIEMFREVAASLPENPMLVTHESGYLLLDSLHNPPPSPNVLFLDLNMPGLNGLEVLKILRTGKSHDKLPIVIFSTSKDETVIQKTLALGASYFVTKPSNFPDFKKSIQHTLQIDWSMFVPSKENFVYANN